MSRRVDESKAEENRSCVNIGFIGGGNHRKMTIKEAIEMAEEHQKSCNTQESWNIKNVKKSKCNRSKEE